MKRIIFSILLTSFLFQIDSFSQIPQYIPIDSLEGYWPFNGLQLQEVGDFHHKC